MSALRERLVRAGRAERAPDGVRQRVLRSAAAATLLAGFGKLGAAMAFVALAAAGTAAYSATHSSREVPALRIAGSLRPGDVRRTAAPAAISEPSAAVASPLGSAASAPARMASSLPDALPPVSLAPTRSSLAAEVEVLDEARSALSRGDVPRANVALVGFRRSFPRPILGEEASVLEIETIARGGSLPQARARFQTFRTAHPTSPALGRLARMVGE